MIEAFKQPKFRRSSLKQIEQANEIIAAYAEDRIQLTLRQLYYQFVARDWLANTQKNYKNLGNVLSEARLCGLVDWSAISDLGRVPSVPHHDTDLENFVDSMKDMASAYRLSRWAEQPYYVELGVEKQAMSSVLGPIADQYEIPFSMNRGYASQTAFYDTANRFKEAAQAGKECVYLYAGDHDPSGLDMGRDFADRMTVFGAEVEFRRFAITMAQIKQYKCPPNPAKEKDARAAEYIRQHGDKSWEVDALDPKVLRKAAEKEIKSLIEPKAWQAVEDREAAERETIADALARIELE